MPKIFVDGEQQLEIFFIGAFKNGIMNGNVDYFFRETDLNLKKVSGSFVNHQLPNGVLELRDGSKYVGGFALNPQTGLHEIEGKGIIEFSKDNPVKKVDGVFYRDETADVKIEYWNGDQYIGKTLNGLREGLGKYIFKEGGSIDGNWRQGKKNGTMRETFKNGYYQESQYADGSLIGPVQRFNPKGQIINPQTYQTSPDFSWGRENPSSSWFYGPGGTINGGYSFELKIGF